MNHDECACLFVLRTQTEIGIPCVVSCWKLTRQELDEVNRTGRVWLIVLGRTMPPVAIDGVKPLIVE